MADWSAVYLHDTLAAAPAVAATGFAAFSLAMAAGRFAGDRLVDGFGAGRVVRVSSTVAAIGLAAALLLGRPAAGIVGFGLVGVGIANIIPVLFGAAARVPWDRAGARPGRGGDHGLSRIPGRAAAHRSGGGRRRAGAGAGARQRRVRAGRARSGDAVAGRADTRGPGLTERRPVALTLDRSRASWQVSLRAPRPRT